MEPGVRSRMMTFLADRRGATGVEYALVAGLLALAIAGVSPYASGAVASQSTAFAKALALSGSTQSSAEEGRSRRFVN